MRWINRQYVKVICSEHHEVFEKSLNSYLDSLTDEGVKYELTFNTTMGLCVYVVSSKAVAVPETLAERAELAGVARKCGDCVHLLRNSDKRRKWFYCEFKESSVSKDTGACEPFYKLGFERGVDDGCQD